MSVVDKAIRDGAGLLRGKEHGKAGETWRKSRGGSSKQTKPKKPNTLREAQDDARRRTSKGYINTSPDARKARMLMAKQTHKKNGTRYDPLSSISTKNGSSGANAKAAAKRTAKVAKVQKKIVSRNSGLSKKESRAKARAIVKSRK